MSFANRKTLLWGDDRRLVGALLIGSVFLLSHAYTGIRHDGILYAGDALAYLVGGQFHEDLYFLHGSQGRFSVLPWIYSRLIAAFGLGIGSIVGLLTAFGLYLGATVLLLKAIVPRSFLFYCLLSVVLGWTLYGGLRVFGYSEAFLTARSFAEPSVLIALALLARGRLPGALLATAIGLVIHPLVGLSGALVVWMLLVMGDRRWLWLAAIGIIPLLYFSFHPVGPFADLLLRYDADWFDLVDEANPQAFLLRWTLYDVGIVVFDIVVLWFVARDSTTPFLRRLVVAAVVIGLASLMFSCVLVDLLHSAFIAKLQIWRSLWVTHWLAMAALPIVLAREWRRDAHGRLSAALLGIGWAAPFSIALMPLGVGAMLVVLLKKRFSLSRPTIVAVCALAALIAVIIAAQYELRIVKLANLGSEPMRIVLGRAASMSLVLLAVALAVWYFAAHARRVGLVAATLLFVLATMVWDQRTPWTKRLESYAVGTNIWPDIVEPGAVVYWYRDLMAPWVLLSHGNYYTQQQGSGAVFSKAMVFELNKRRKITAILDLQEQICRMMNNLTEKQDRCEPDSLAVSTVCIEGGIDYIVIQTRLENKEPVAEFSTAVFQNGYEKKFYLYRCSALKPR